MLQNRAASASTTWSTAKRCSCDSCGSSARSGSFPDICSEVIAISRTYFFRLLRRHVGNTSTPSDVMLFGQRPDHHAASYTCPERIECMRENLDIDTKTLALYYAWDHFAYHAGQRQTVFNYFVLLLGGCVAAWSATIGQSGAEYNYFRIFLGVVLALASLVFWRLDQRNARLVKVSEDALKDLEAQMAKDIKVPSIRLMENAGKRVSKFPLLESFGQIYGLIFAVSGIVGIAMAILSARG